MEIKCQIKRIKSANDSDFQQALKIYHQQVGVCIRTDENQLMQYASGKFKNTSRDMIFYALKCNDIVIGYAEVGILNETKVFFIDYFVLASQYQNNSYFYICYNLMIKDLMNISKYSSFKYIIAENYTNDTDNINELFGKKCLALENYKIIDVIYLQPGLDFKTNDSVVNCQLLIKETSETNDLKKMSKPLFLNILKDIYYNHYCEWYSHFFTKNDFNLYKEKVQELFNSIEQKTDSEIKLKNYTYINCKYFNTKCDFNQNSKFSVPKKINIVLFIIIQVVVALFSVAMAIGCYYLLKNIFKFEDAIIVGVLSIVPVIFSIVASSINIRLNLK